MKMTERKRKNSPVDCSSVFFPRKTLPDKIIRLRKISQENHVRRMKLAYKMKEVSGVSGISPSFPVKRYSNSKLPSVTPATAKKYTGKIQSTKTELFQPLSARPNSAVIRKRNSDSFKDNLEKKSASVKIVQKRLFGTENKTNFAGGDCCYSHSFTKNKSMTKINDRFENELQSEINTVPNDKKEHSPRNNKDESERKNNDLHPSKSPSFIIDINASEEEKNERLPAKKTPSKIPIITDRNASEEEKKKRLPAKKTPSKIPIWKSRLKIKSSPEKNKSPSKDNSNEVTEESLESMLNDAEKQFKEFNLQETEEKKHEDIHFEDSYTLPQLECLCCEGDACTSLYNTSYENEESRHETSLIDKWMSGLIITEDSSENSRKASALSKFTRMARNSPSLTINSLVTLRRDITPDHVDIDKDPRISTKYDYITDITGSDKSSGTYYGVDEIAYESSRQTDDRSRWNNFETASTITIPSDEDLEFADHRDPVFKSLPDYPNTPYNLRYPRYRFKKYDNIFSSLDVDSPNHVNRAKGLKNRRKCYSATPKSVRSGKKKKIKKQIARNKKGT